MGARAKHDLNIPIVSGWRFLSIAFLGSLAVALVSVFLGLAEQVSVLGVVASSHLGIQLAYLEYARARDRRQFELISALGMSENLVLNPSYLAFHRRMTLSLSTLADSDNRLLQDQALSRLVELNAKIADMADGKLVFERTETWRTVYEEMLRKPEVKEYRSVSWFRSEDYWQDPPGRQSLDLNCQLAEEGLLIHRNVIVPESLWPIDQNLPNAPIIQWIEKQHTHGIWILLTRESSVAKEPALLVDFGIYGDVAVGTQIVDREGRTSRFEIDFRQDERLAAQRVWDRLKLFATSYADLLDREQNLP